MSDVQLLDECLTVMLAGHETTALALMFALDQLTRHPELMARLEAELEHELAGRPATLDDVPKLRLTRAIVKETLRLFPPAWAAGRVAIADFTLGGLPVTRGTQLVVVPWVVHKDERFYQDPLAYRPDRFLNGETEGLPKGAYFPFGAGPRVCIGYHFAELEAALVMATLVQRCRFTAQDPAPLGFAPSVTLRPAGPVRLGVELRPRATAEQAAQ